jgi:Predicted integral membrane protein
LNYARRAAELDPLTPFNHHNIGWGLYFARRYDESIEQYQQVVRDFPDYVFGFYGLSKIHRLNGMFESSLTEIEDAINIMGESVFTELAKAECLAAGGQVEAAKGSVMRLSELSKTRYVSPYQLALTYCFLAVTESENARDHIDKAFSLLDQAVEMKDAWLNWLGVEPAFDILRSDERFSGILTKIGYQDVLSENSQFRLSVPDRSGMMSDGRATLIIDPTDTTDGGASYSEPQRGRLRLYASAAVFILLLSGSVVWISPWLSLTVGSNTAALTNTIQNPSLIVLPFSTQEPKDDSIGAGFADALSLRLGGIKAIQVLSANTGRIIAVSTPTEAARELNVTYLLKGEIEKSDLAYVIHAELLDVAGGHSVWKETFQSTEGSMFLLQTQIARRIADSLNITLLPTELKRLEKSYSTDPAVYERYLVGRSQMTSRSSDGLRLAIENFEAVVANDPTFVPGYVGLADSFSLLNLYSVDPPADAYAKAKKHAEKAIQLDNEFAEAHASLGYIRFYSERDREAAELEFRRAIQMNPSYAQARHWFALVLSAMNKPVDAVTEIQTAERLDPRSLAIRAASAMVYFFDQKYDRALSECERALETDPNFVPALKVKRWIYQATGDMPAAKEAFLRERESMGGSADDAGWQIIEAQLTETNEERSESSRKLSSAIANESVRDNDFVYAFEIALAYAHLGSPEKCLEWLERAEEAGNHSFNFFDVDPRFAGIRSESGFTILSERLRTKRLSS